MAYKIERSGDYVVTVEPRHWWSTVTYRDLVRALAELSVSNRVTQVVRYWNWSGVNYIVVVEPR